MILFYDIITLLLILLKNMDIKVLEKSEIKNKNVLFNICGTVVEKKESVYIVF